MPQLELVSPFSASAEAIRSARDISRLMCRTATTDHELRLHHRIRREVFVAEQGLFVDDDHDERDDRRDTVHVLGLCGAVAAGAVRCYPLDEPGLWKGDRLAVLPSFRRSGLGGPLVRFAVSTAGTLGGEQMVAYIQPQNVAVFAHLGWRAVGAPVDYVGRPHQRMVIDLRAGPADPQAGRR